ncbi:sigma-54-dependent Fis family transcriptional regulator [Flavipsychrobacter stenotrophus]|uniref:Sigma-54-dependent Fis family transcriptional regulator n=1 Tax=Flavipsychrobacter stenotrophus TaxID=2077091 RepID=A0A2S7SX02_9BACT|nr:sigma-54 dependent transcriptional regulator [Flavipsychrobacter stenotrophus]PQJ11453.1 sigma-54-dependent Fis family transcriptional regulator [Flavipsychrobacter stenotrophus]
MHNILVVDDDNDMCLLLSRFLSRNGYTVATANSGQDAIAWMKKNTPSLVLCDFRLDDMTGTELLGKIKEAHPAASVIIITGYSDVKDAVEVMKLGAFDYVTKPLFPDEILLTIKKALSDEPKDKVVAKPSAAGTTTSSAKAKNTNSGQYIMGDSPEFAVIIKQIDLVAPTNFSVIIYGESGSGKEAIAQQIHQKSKRSNKPFVAIDCGALSKELAGSELFGHEKGAFTGALNQKIGSLELANEGTIFLDEIGNLSYDIQVSLLRVVQERKIRRVGGIKDIDLDVRILVASNERLWDAARAGKFREDLYHRFNEFSIDVPALRDRTNDIMLFAHHFLNVTNAELGKNVKGFSAEVTNIFNNYIWYGNLRELKNVVKRSTLLTDGDLVEAKSLPFEISNFSKLQFELPAPAVKKDNTQPGTNNQGSFENKLKSANMDAEYEVILNALKQVNFNKSKAAKLLNVDRKTLYNKMKQFKEFNVE